MKKIFVLTFIFCWMSNLFGHDYIPFKSNGKIGLLSSKLKVAVKAEHPGFAGSSQMLTLSGSSWDAVNTVVIADNKKYVFSPEFSVTLCNGSYVIFDNYPGVRGKTLYDVKKDTPVFSEFRMNPSGQQIFPASDEGSYYVDAAGNVLFENSEWKRAYGFYNNRAVVETRSKKSSFEIIDTEGKNAGESKFEFLQINFSEGLIAGENEKGEKGFFDINGKLVISLNLYYTEGTISASQFAGGIAYVSTKKDSNLWYCINTKGEILSKEIYSSGIPEVGENKLTRISYEKNGKRKFTYVKTDGSKLVNMDFDRLYSFVNGYAIFEYGDYEGLISSDGKIYLSGDLIKGIKKPVPVDSIR